VLAEHQNVSEKYGMSTGKITKVKSELAELGLISTKKNFRNGKSDEIENY